MCREEVRERERGVVRETEELRERLREKESYKNEDKADWMREGERKR